MMKDFVILTDSSADLTAEMSQELGIRTIQLEVLMDDEEQSMTNDMVDAKEFYAKLRNKKTAKTSAVSITAIAAAIKT